MYLSSEMDFCIYYSEIDKLNVVQLLNNNFSCGASMPVEDLALIFLKLFLISLQKPWLQRNVI